MHIERIELHVVQMPLRQPFATRFGREQDLRRIIVAVSSEGLTGVGEVALFETPSYSDEFLAGAITVLERLFAPAVLGRHLEGPRDVMPLLDELTPGHHHAKAGLEGAIWDLWARRLGLPLWRLVGGQETPVPAGVALGFASSPEALVELVEAAVARGYRRVKLKVAPGRDLPYLVALRRALPELPVMVDGNGAYRRADVPHLAAFDDFRLLLLEQPFPADDFESHALLRQRAATPVCLDEGVVREADFLLAVLLGACDVLNVKLGRLGGWTRTLRLVEQASRRNIRLWCGGMLETGIGRAHNLALASLPGFSLPGDLSPSDRYWQEDLVEPPITMRADGTIPLPNEPGIGYTPRWDQIRLRTIYHVALRA